GRANFGGARQEALLRAQQPAGVALDLPVGVRGDALACRLGRRARRGAQHAASHRQQRERSRALHQKHASLKRLTPFLSITYGTSQKPGAFACDGAAAALVGFGTGGATFCAAISVCDSAAPGGAGGTSTGATLAAATGVRKPVGSATPGSTRRC